MRNTNQRVAVCLVDFIHEGYEYKTGEVYLSPLVRHIDPNLVTITNETKSFATHVPASFVVISQFMVLKKMMSAGALTFPLTNKTSSARTLANQESYERLAGNLSAKDLQTHLIQMNFKQN